MVLSANRRRYTGSVGEKYKLPPEYMRVSWVGSQKKECTISTNISLKDVGGIEMLSSHIVNYVAYSSGGNREMWMLGAVSESKKTGFWYNTENPGDVAAYWKGSGTNLMRIYSGLTMCRMSIDSPGSCTWRLGSTTGTKLVSNESSISQNAEIKLMCNSYMGNNSTAQTTKIYYLKVYGRKADNTKSNSLISYMVPAKRLSDSQVGMYDFIRKQFYYDTSSYNNKVAIYKGSTINNSTDMGLTGISTKWDYHQYTANSYYDQSSAWGKGANARFVAEPGTLTFVNPSQSLIARLTLLDYEGIRRGGNSQDIVGGQTLVWEITKRMQKKAPFLFIMWYKSSGTPTETEIANNNWSLTYN